MSEATRIARTVRLAALHPDASLACPLCGAGVREAVLATHLERVHHAAVDPGAPRLEKLPAADRTLFGPFLGFVAVWVSLAALAALSGVRLSDALVAVFTVGLLVALFGAALAGFDRLPGVLELDGSTLRFRGALGLRTRVIVLAPPLEVGSILDVRPGALFGAQPGMEGQGELAVAGRYLRLRGEGGELVVATRERTGFRRQWSDAGWRAGGKRKRWDVTLRRPEMIALEQHLAELGILTPRAGSA